MIINSFYPLMGGAEKQAERLSSELINKNKDVFVTVITRHYRGLKRREFVSGIEVIRLPAIGPGKLKPLTFLIYCFLYLLLKNKKYDVLHAHSLSLGGFAVALFGKIFNKPAISKIAGGGSSKGCEAINMYCAGGLKRWRLNYIKKNISKVIAISDAINSDLKKLGFSENTIERINNGISMERNNTKSSDVLSLSNSFDVYVYTGRYELIKGTDILLKAWYGTSEDFRKSSKLVLMGKGSIDVQSLIKDGSVINMGYVENTEEYLVQGNYFILPSRYEGISNALLEAIKNNNFVIASNVGGNKDIIKNGLSGFIFEKESVSDLISKLELTKKIERKEKEDLIASSYSHLDANFNLNKISESYKQLYKRVIEEK
ncbi:glycosyltransferase [Salinicoccus sesuvii]|uniref:Glycosyltransferase n=2 Tax=Salinicoccus sesuvii TaxID=868281 RepID=A0ABV7N991_9STAP